MHVALRTLGITAESYFAVKERVIIALNNRSKIRDQIVCHLLFSQLCHLVVRESQLIFTGAEFM